jgi:hypothetical protein
VVVEAVVVMVAVVVQEVFLQHHKHSQLDLIQ